MTHDAPPAAREPTDTHVGSPAIGTTKAVDDPAINRRTGEPRRPWPLFIATPLIYLGVAAIVGGMLWTFWWSIDDFAGSSLLHSWFPTGPGDLLRVGLVTGEFALVMLIGTLALITGYYAWWGYRWTRWWGIIAAVVSGGAWIINPIAGAGSVAILVGVGLLWLPMVAAFDARWYARRHPAAPTPDIRDSVFYGPLPRYR